MRDSVSVDGVTLTADQVKRAWEEINKPEQPKAGTVVINIGSGARAVVVSSYPRSLACNAIGRNPDTHVTVVSFRDGDFYSVPLDRFSEYYRLEPKA